MRVEIIPCLKDNYSYLIIDDSNKSACVVDPSEAEPIINYLKNKDINLKYILNTHHHFDHIGGNEDLKKRFGSIVVGIVGSPFEVNFFICSIFFCKFWLSGSFFIQNFELLRVYS